MSPSMCTHLHVEVLGATALMNRQSSLCVSGASS
uniref:Uncharacterized protein n=1 Tax=Trichinella nativa TaxID=6335 RepID=A0A0V1KIM7_9BILA